MEKTRMKRTQKSRIWRTIVVVMAGLGLMAVISPPDGLAQSRDNIELMIRQANTPADHQALAAWYKQKAQAAQQLASQHLMMREVYAAARSMERKDRAGEYWAFVAKKDQEMAREYETLAAVHRMVAEQLK
jgi:hypothetical protein